jgi:hypothetical protein
MLEGSFDLSLVVELAADVEKAIRGQADVTIRELVVFGAEHALAQRTPGGHRRLAAGAITKPR